MAWKKKIDKACGDDLQPGEQLIEGVLVHQAGFTMKLGAKAIGGLVGAALATRVQASDDLDSGSGSASQLPKETLVLGVTDRRLIVWGWAKLTGKPKGLKASFPLADIAGVEVETRKASVAFALVFADGSGVTLEAPRLANDPDNFAVELNARCGN